MDVFLIVYLIIVVAPIGTFIHELGHVIGARIAKADKVVLTIGMGKQLFKISFNSVKISFRTIFFVGGNVNSTRIRTYNTLERMYIAILGPVNNAVFSCLFYFIYVATNNVLLQLLFLFNLWLAVINIIPFKIKTRQSDGFTILQVIRKWKHNKIEG